MYEVWFRQIRAIAILWKYGGDYGMDCYGFMTTLKRFKIFIFKVFDRICVFCKIKK